MEVLGVTSYGDVSSFAQQQSRASSFILSIDDEEFGTIEQAGDAVARLSSFVDEIRFRNADIPIFLYGRDAHLAPHPQQSASRAARLHPYIRGHPRLHGAPHHP